MSMNVWCFTGRLGKDAETRNTSSGSQVLQFSVAVDVGYGDRKTTIWPRCSLFGERGGKLLQYLTKGTQVAVSGEVNLREWQGQDGSNRTSLEVRVINVDLVGGRPDSAGTRQEPQKPNPPKLDPTTYDDDDIPF